MNIAQWKLHLHNAHWPLNVAQCVVLDTFCVSYTACVSYSAFCVSCITGSLKRVERRLEQRPKGGKGRGSCSLTELGKLGIAPLIIKLNILSREQDFWVDCKREETFFQRSCNISEMPIHKTFSSPVSDERRMGDFVLTLFISFNEFFLYFVTN